jgi:hypothetical protein
LRYSSRRITVELLDDDAGTELRATWEERDGTPGRLDARVDLPPGHESLNVVIPWSDTTFQYTSKHQARPARGVLVVGDTEWRFGADTPAWGVLDVGRGRWPYRTNWNWGGGAGRAGAGGPVVGLQLGGKWTEGTGATENGLLVDGRLTKIGAELEWDYRWDDPLAPWKVRAPDGSLDLVLHPKYDKHSRTEIGVMGMEVHQVFGHWSGTARTDDGRVIAFEDLQGFAEECRARWRAPSSWSRAGTSSPRRGPPPSSTRPTWIPRSSTVRRDARPSRPRSRSSMPISSASRRRRRSTSPRS